jgi:hypothetical protein
MVKTRRRPPHAGGRPLAFIPVAVVERARELAAKGFSFSTVVRSLEREGNGAWPRRTLLRRVRSTSSSAKYSAGQNSQLQRAAAGAGEQLERVAKTTAVERLEAALEAATWGTPAYDRALRARHAFDGPCKCSVCDVDGRRRR